MKELLFTVTLIGVAGWIWGLVGHYRSKAAEKLATDRQRKLEAEQDARSDEKHRLTTELQNARMDLRARDTWLEGQIRDADPETARRLAGAFWRDGRVLADPNRDAAGEAVPRPTTATGDPDRGGDGP